jgi:hypothetical protein
MPPALVCSDTSPEGEPHPNGFEWCVNEPAVDARGNVYANAEDGFVYQIGQGGILKTQTSSTRRSARRTRRSRSIRPGACSR